MKDFRDVYEFPLEIKHTSTRVYDAKGNFVFHFKPGLEKEFRDKVLRIINGESEKVPGTNYFHRVEDGEICEGVYGTIITIRGWGNLTGVGGHNLPGEVAANIQDTFAEFIVERLNANL